MLEVDKIWQSILDYLDAFAIARVPPFGGTRRAPRSDSNALRISQLLIVLILAAVARALLAGSALAELSTTTIMSGVVLTGLLLVGILAHMLFPPGQTRVRTQRASTFTIVYLTLTLILYILIDGIVEIRTGTALTSRLLIPLVGYLGVSAEWVKIGASFFFSLLAWALFIVKGYRENPNFSWRSGVWTIEFPFFVALNAAFFYCLALWQG